MSIIKKIEGWADDFDIHPGSLAASLTIWANARHGDQPVIAIIGGKGWTDDEVRAMLVDLLRMAENATTQSGDKIEFVHTHEVRDIAAKHGITI